MSARRSFRGGSRVARTRVAATAVLLVAALLTGCAGLFPSPKTSYVNVQGETVTVDWRDFPGTGGTEARAILDGPTVEEAADRSASVLAATRDAISEYLGGSVGLAEWNTDRSDANGPATWSPGLDNGYGGRSMLQIYNSHVWELEIQIPADEWDALLEAVGSTAAGLGLTDRFEHAPEDPADARWFADATSSRGSEFLSVSITDASLDNEVLLDAKKSGHAVASVTLMCGVSAIQESDRAAFKRRAAPFEGLEHPDTTS